MNNCYKNIKINGVLYTENILLELAKQKLLQRSIAEWEKDIYFFILEWLSEVDAIDIQTSGSTGNQKIISLRKQSMLNSAKITQKYFRYKKSHNALLCLPAKYIAGKMMIVRAFVSQFNLIPVAPSSNPFLQMEDIIDFTAITPFQLYHSVPTLKEKKIKTILVGGSAVSEELYKSIQNFKTNIYETYGMTETCSHIAVRQINTLPLTSFTVLDEIKIETDLCSCLVIDAPGLHSGKIITNDVVELKNKKEFNWLGRFDNMINSGGIKLFPEQIERKISGAIKGDFFITGLPDIKLGTVVSIVINNENHEQDDDEIRSILSDKLEKYEIPKKIVRAKKFYYSSTGKLLRKEIMNKLFV